MLIFLVGDIFNFNVEEIVINFSTLFVYFIFYLLFIFVYYLIYIFISKFKYLNINNELIINENGIIDYNVSKNIKIVCEWESILRVVVTKHAIIILTKDKKLNLFFPRSEEIIINLNKFNSDIFSFKL